MSWAQALAHSRLWRGPASTKCTNLSNTMDEKSRLIMPEKQNLYDILGLPGSASAAEIERAFALHRKILESDTGIEDRRNRLAFIRHARDVLSDPQQRARYDLQLHRQAALVIGENALPISSRLRWIVLLVLAVGLAWAWHHYYSPPRPGTPASPVNPPPAPDAGADTVSAWEGLPPEDSGAARAGVDTAAPSAAPPARPGPKENYTINVNTSNAELIKKLVWSVYGILGPKALGTGVMVDNEGLLTNCHVLAANMPLNGKKIYAINAVTMDHAEITEVAYLANQDACLVRAPGLSGQAVETGSTTWMAAGIRTHNIGYARGQLTASPGEFLYWLNKYGQNFLVTNNYCDHGVSGGPLVDDDGRLVGLTTGGNRNRSRCASLTVETVRSLRFQPTIPINDFPTGYVSNITRRAW